MDTKDIKSIAIVVPTIRPESFAIFMQNWKYLFLKHNTTVISIKDGDEPKLLSFEEKSVKEIMDEDSDLIYNFNDGVRNLGFAYIAKFLPDIEYIITLDDDCYPMEGTDPIQDHIDALNMKVPVSWISTASEYMRGFPYEIRDEAEVVLSHGVWEGVKDWDAPTQLTRGNRDVTFYKGVVPKGVLFPMCIMNVAFKRKILPYMYQAPAYKDYQRFSDIWCGINAKRAIDEKGWAAVTGYSTIYHSRASNVYTNLKKEARGIGINEGYWKGEISEDDKEYFDNYHTKMKRWENLMKQYVHSLENST